MNTALVDQIVQAVLYEGYILYPYRPSSKKNQRGRFTFGRIYPRAFSAAQHGAEPCLMQTECLVRPAISTPTLTVTVRFLQPLAVAPDTGWRDAAERTVRVPIVLPGRARQSFQFDSLAGLIEVECDASFKVSVRIHNSSPATAAELASAETILPRTFASTHTILHIDGGEFISALDPESEGRCHNVGAWPVLVGDEAKGERDTILSSPIILSDYPQIAPQSSGDFFDGTEIDEMLALRVQTMTDAEKLEMRSVNECARRLLERVESMPEEHLWNLHGLMHKCDDAPYRAGDRVRIRPKSRADAFDIILAGKVAVVEAVEQDAEGKIHLALVLDDDPGKDMGMQRQVGHRFFYGLEEVEPV